MSKRTTSILNRNEKYVYFLYPLYILILFYNINKALSDDSSSIINTETLTSFIRYSLNDSDANYATITTTPLGNLICSASYFNTLTIKYYYGLKPDGRPYFTKDSEETEFLSTDSDRPRNEGNIYGIQLEGSSLNDKEYIIALGNNNGNFELYDFSLSNPVVSIKEGNSFFGSEYLSFKYGTIFKLKNGDNQYILSLILQLTGNVKYFHVFRLSFSSTDIVNNSPIKNTYKDLSQVLSFTSCFEDDSNNIICFYIYPNGDDGIYTIEAFDYDLNRPNQYAKYANFANALYEETIFYKGIHFTGVVGAFLYIKKINNDENKICIQFMKFESNFNNYFGNSLLNPLTIDNNGYSIYVQKSDMIKIAERKFCYITLSTDSSKLHIFMFYNFVEEKFIVRHYTVKAFEKNNFYFGQELRMDLYNDFIALATVGNFAGSNSYSYLIIFSYPNSTDFSVDITDILKSGKYPIINFIEKCKIENNIFGYEPVGVKLLDFTSGLKLVTEDDKNEINVGNIFIKNVELIFDENINFSSNLRIEYTMVVKDAPYSSFKDYSEIININLCNNDVGECEEESYYQQTEHIGRTSYCDIIIDSDQISKTCEANCFLCKKDTQECLICEDNFQIKQDNNKECTDEIILPSTTKIANPSTITEKISTTKIENMPSTIMENTPTTITKNNPTIIPNPNIREIPSTLLSIKNTEKKIETNAIIINDNKNGKNCSISEILNNKCLDGQININQINEIKNSLLTEDYKGENTIIETETVIIQLSKLEDQANQDNVNISNIDLGECEDLLRETNNLEEDEDLIIYKIDIKTSDSSSTYVTYEVYDSHLNQLNLDVCSETQITIQVPVHLDDTLDSLAKSLSDSGYNLFNENDSFYNDICATFTSENGTDMLLSDRKKDIYSNTQNTSICQSDCELESYNSTSKKAKCNCEVKTSSTISSLNIDNLFNKKEIAKNFYDTLANSNFLVLKCYKLVIDFSIVLKNYGEIIMTALMLIFLIMMIIYFMAGSRKIHEFLYTILKWNVENSPDKNNKFEEESIVNSQEKKIVHESIRERKVKKGKRIKFKTENAPPKIRKREHVKFGSVVNNNITKNNNKAGKLMSSTSDLKQIKSEGMDIKKNKNKIRDEKRRHHTNKDYNTKKNFNETEENNKKENLETGYVDYKKKDLTDTELDDLEYELAIIYDKRTFFEFYWCVLKQNQLIIFTFLPMNDFNLIYAKIALFIISFGLFITINGFFFSDDTMHKVYKDNGKFDILFQIPQILYSSIISSVANILLKNLSLSENNILELKQETYFSINKAKKKARQIERCLRIKLILFFIISLILMLFFWYFISCFCAVYRNTQIILLKDTGISFGLSLVYPFALSFLPGIFRIPALRAKNQNLKCLYKISSIMNWLI